MYFSTLRWCSYVEGNWELTMLFSHITKGVSGKQIWKAKKKLLLHVFRFKAQYKLAGRAEPVIWFVEHVETDVGRSEAESKQKIGNSFRNVEYLNRWSRAAVFSQNVQIGRAFQVSLSFPDLSL